MANWKVRRNYLLWLIGEFCVIFRDNTTDAQECNGLGTCLCGDCVCTKEGVSKARERKIRYNLIVEFIFFLVSK